MSLVDVLGSLIKHCNISMDLYLFVADSGGSRGQIRGVGGGGKPPGVM